MALFSVSCFVFPVFAACARHDRTASAGRLRCCSSRAPTSSAGACAPAVPSRLPGVMLAARLHGLQWTMYASPRPLLAARAAQHAKADCSTHDAVCDGSSGGDNDSCKVARTARCCQVVFASHWQSDLWAGGVRQADKEVLIGLGGMGGRGEADRPAARPRGRRPTGRGQNQGRRPGGRGSGRSARFVSVTSPHL